MPSRNAEERQAMLTLLSVDDDSDQHRYRLMQTEVVQPQSQSQVVHKQNKRRFRGKENNDARKQPLPKLKSNKEELKMRLRKLEEVDPVTKGDNLSKLNDRTLSPLLTYDNEGLSQAKTTKNKSL
jgi:hypothetical protein